MDNIEEVIDKFAKLNNITLEEACNIIIEYYNKQKEEMNKTHKETKNNYIHYKGGEDGSKD